MKIALIDSSVWSVDVISVPDKWLEEDLRSAVENLEGIEYEDEEWADMVADEIGRVETFLYQWCQYDPNNITYIINPKDININMTHKDFN